MHADLHVAYLLIGSNIEAEVNIPQAIQRLRQFVEIEAVSMTWETQAVGSPGPNFLNTAVKITTGLEMSALKFNVLRTVEQELGRIRTSDKNAPRTIDLDIIVFDDEICDSNIWQVVFGALPMAELLPNLKHPQTGQTLREAAKVLRHNNLAVAHPELRDLIK